MEIFKRMDAGKLRGLALTLNVLALVQPVAVHAMDISWNGFGSFYDGQALHKELMPEGFTDTHVNFTSFSLVGLNLASSVNDDLSFAAQFVALGMPVGESASFDLFAQWAFVNYTPSETISIHLGRQLYPSLLASDYVRVGFLLPFRQVPSGVFGIEPFTRFDGISAAKTFGTSLGKLTLGVFGGNPLLDISTIATSQGGLTFGFADLIGAEVTLDGDGWRIRAQASRFLSQLTEGSPLPANTLSGHTQNFSIGYRYDKGNIVSWSEYTLAQTPDGTTLNRGKYVGIGRGFYWLGGYRFGKFMPRYTFAVASDDFNILGANGYTNGKTTSHTVGINYQLGLQAVAKVEYELDLIPSPQNGSYFVVQPAGSTITSAGAFYAGVDFIF